MIFRVASGLKTSNLEFLLNFVHVIQKRKICTVGFAVTLKANKKKLSKYKNCSLCGCKIHAVKLDFIALSSFQPSSASQNFWGKPSNY